MVSSAPMNTATMIDNAASLASIGNLRPVAKHKQCMTHCVRSYSESDVYNAEGAESICKPHAQKNRRRIAPIQKRQHAHQIRNTKTASSPMK